MGGEEHRPHLDSGPGSSLQSQGDAKSRGRGLLPEVHLVRVAHDVGTAAGREGPGDRREGTLQARVETNEEGEADVAEQSGDVVDGDRRSRLRDPAHDYMRPAGAHLPDSRTDERRWVVGQRPDH